ncbi:hypothetical protein BP6252_11350 [Coleophoma cylindrospora]|uniref:Wax synthase domain-containing protein n=1 Tax=Coleophoma cylindrospora TaxID=1849047 RepID=A0A3D8QPR9_9HELO|nr:hypothetical protein BP6252_11350 [Coleophoma cylindrospora]
MSPSFAFLTPLEERIRLPPWYLPSFLLVGTLTTLAPLEYRILRTVVGGIALGTLVYNTPKYTTGGVSSDFVVGLFVSGITLKFWDFVYYRRAEEYAWRVPTLNPTLAPAKQNGSVLVTPNGTGNGESKRSDDCASNVELHGKFNSTWEKFRWSWGLWTTTRGVEWNWGVKDLMPVPPENLDRLITSPSTAIITKLGLKRGTNLSKYANLWISFFFSAMCHTFAQYLITRSEGGNILNWMSQAAVITFEDFVIDFAQYYGIKGSAWTRAFGYLWVGVWLSLYPSLPLGANTVLQIGGAYDPPGVIEPSALFPPRKTSDTLLKVAVDYGASWYCVQRGLTLINARNVDEVLAAVTGIVGAAALYFARD